MLVIVNKCHLKITVLSDVVTWQVIIKSACFLNPSHESFNWQNWGNKCQEGERLDSSSFFLVLYWTKHTSFWLKKGYFVPCSTPSSNEMLGLLHYCDTSCWHIAVHAFGECNTALARITQLTIPTKGLMHGKKRRKSYRQLPCADMCIQMLGVLAIKKCVQHKHSWPVIQISAIKKQKSLTSSVQVFYFDSLLAVSSLEDLLGQRKTPEGGH